MILREKVGASWHYDRTPGNGQLVPVVTEANGRGYQCENDTRFEMRLEKRRRAGALQIRASKAAVVY